MRVLYADWDKARVRYQRQKDGAEFRDKERKRMRSPKVTNVMARPRVQNKESFQGNNLFGQWMTRARPTIQPLRSVQLRWVSLAVVCLREWCVVRRTQTSSALQRPSIDRKHIPMKIRYP